MADVPGVDIKRLERVRKFDNKWTAAANSPYVRKFSPEVVTAIRSYDAGRVTRGKDPLTKQQTGLALLAANRRVVPASVAPPKRDTSSFLENALSDLGNLGWGIVKGAGTAVGDAVINAPFSPIGAVAKLAVNADNMISGQQSVGSYLAGATGVPQLLQRSGIADPARDFRQEYHDKGLGAIVDRSLAAAPGVRKLLSGDDVTTLLPALLNNPALGNAPGLGGHSASGAARSLTDKTIEDAQAAAVKKYGDNPSATQQIGSLLAGPGLRLVPGMTTVGNVTADGPGYLAEHPVSSLVDVMPYLSKLASFTKAGGLAKELELAQGVKVRPIKSALLRKVSEDPNLIATATAATTDGARVLVPNAAGQALRTLTDALGGRVIRDKFGSLARETTMTVSDMNSLAVAVQSGKPVPKAMLDRSPQLAKLSELSQRAVAASDEAGLDVAGRARVTEAALVGTPEALAALTAQEAQYLPHVRAMNNELADVVNSIPGGAPIHKIGGEFYDEATGNRLLASQRRQAAAEQKLADEVRSSVDSNVTATPKFQAVIDHIIRGDLKSARRVMTGEAQTTGRGAFAPVAEDLSAATVAQLQRAGTTIDSLLEQQGTLRASERTAAGSMLDAPTRILSKEAKAELETLAARESKYKALHDQLAADGHASSAVGRTLGTFLTSVADRRRALLESQPLAVAADTLGSPKVFLERRAAAMERLAQINDRVAELNGILPKGKIVPKAKRSLYKEKTRLVEERAKLVKDARALSQDPVVRGVAGHAKVAVRAEKKAAAVGREMERVRQMLLKQHDRWDTSKRRELSGPLTEGYTKFIDDLRAGKVTPQVMSDMLDQVVSHRPITEGTKYIGDAGGLNAGQFQRLRVAVNNTIKATTTAERQAKKLSPARFDENVRRGVGEKLIASAEKLKVHDAAQAVDEGRAAFITDADISRVTQAVADEMWSDAVLVPHRIHAQYGDSPVYSDLVRAYQASQVRKMSNDVSATWQQMRAAGIDPVWLKQTSARAGKFALSPSVIGKVSAIGMTKGRATPLMQPSFVKDVQFAVQAAQVDVIETIVQGMTTRLIAEKHGIPAALIAPRYMDKARRMAERTPGLDMRAYMDRLIAKDYMKFDEVVGVSGMKIAGNWTNDLVIPREVGGVLKEMANPTRNLLNVVLDGPTKLFRIAVTSLSPRTHLNNMTGNAIMVAAMNPGAFKELATARAFMQAADDVSRAAVLTERFGPAGRQMADSMGSALSVAERGTTARDLADNFGYVNFSGGVKRSQLWDKAHEFAPFRWGEKVFDTGNAVVNRSLALNGLVDDFGKTAVMLDEAGKLMKRGLDPELAMMRGLERSRRVSMNWAALTPFERSVLRPIVPFYSWTRHLAQYITNLPLDHSMRTSILANLAESEMDDEASGYPAILRNMVFFTDTGRPDGSATNQTGVNIGSMNPFTQATQPFAVLGFLTGNSKRAGESVGSVNPLLKWGMQTLGIDPRAGTADAFPELQWDSAQGGLAVTSPDQASGLLTSLVPQSAAFFHFLGMQDEWRQQMQNDPSSFNRLLASSFGIPLVTRQRNVPEVFAKTAVKLEDAQSKVYNNAVRTGDYSEADRWPGLKAGIASMKQLSAKGQLDRYMLTEGTGDNMSDYQKMKTAMSRQVTGVGSLPTNSR